MDANSSKKGKPQSLSVQMAENVVETNAIGLPPPSIGLGPSSIINQSIACRSPGKADADVFKSPEAIKSFYNLSRDLKINSNSGKHGKDNIKKSTFESTSTTTETLPLWIYALQESLFIEIGNQETYTVEWKNKTNKSGNIIEIELKTTKASKPSSGSPAHLYSVCVYLSTGLILIRGNELDQFITDVFPKAKAIVHDLQNLKASSNEPTTFSEAEHTNQPTNISQNVELANEIKEIKAGITQLSKINMNKLSTKLQENDDLI